MNPVKCGQFLARGTFIYSAQRNDQTSAEILELQRNLVI
jgi:hypothetical protein